MAPVIGPMSCGLLIAAGLAQLAVGACALAWAWPVFADPPFLGNGLTTEFLEVKRALAADPALSDTIRALRRKLEWLFERQAEGTLVALALGITSVVAGLVSIGVAALALHANHRAGHRLPSRPE